VKSCAKYVKDVKAVSPIIATLLMIVISVVAGVMIYGWITGFISTGVPETPKSYIVTVSSVQTHDATAVSGDQNATVLKAKISNPGAKDIDVTCKNFLLTKTDGSSFDYTNASTLMVYRVQGTAFDATNQTDMPAEGNYNATYTTTLTAGKSSDVYIEILGGDTGATTGALTKGSTYIINIQDASTYDGISVTSAQATFKANK
jgi:FlaG/FlaF family flagellin (archaellin)